MWAEPGENMSAEFPARMFKRGNQLTVNLRDGVNYLYDHDKKACVIDRPDRNDSVVVMGKDMIMQPPQLPPIYWFWLLTYTKHTFPSAAHDNDWN
jgi:hypothetical protein